jgi:hypothetical protein
MMTALFLLLPSFPVFSPASEAGYGLANESSTQIRQRFLPRSDPVRIIIVSCIILYVHLSLELRKYFHATDMDYPMESSMQGHDAKRIRFF